MADAQALLLVDEVWQLAFAAGYQRELAGKLIAVGQLRTTPAGAQ